MQTSSDAIYGARHVALKAGVPIEVPALTVNRLCGSGIQAAVSGAQLIQLDEADIVLSGGIESMSQAPHVIRGLRSGLQARPGQARGFALRGAARSVLRPVHGADGGEVRGEVQHLTRGSRTSTRCAASRPRRPPGPPAGSPTRSCRSRSRSRKGVTVVDRDDHLRPDTTLEGLAKLPAAFSKDGTVTAGNASGIVDGGAALLARIGEGGRRTRSSAARPPGRVGRRRRRARVHGDGSGAGDPEGARSRRPDARRRSISSRSTRRSPASISQWRRSSASIATGRT